ncbi:PqqD family protein [uncultured Eubacterium sp.]|uniref:PqqD family protein n=1 Tax=uncultured Eubacterium sp. TaxID=165185 RepID=UPI0026713D30|nr:PqqD family protein [uncultured Eubacterium sp.]
MKNRKKNYIDNIPRIVKAWELTEDGMVEVVVKNIGIFYRITQKLLKKPMYSFIKLDMYGSCVWQHIDGKRSIYEIGRILEKEHSRAAEQLYERLSIFFRILERNQFIVFENKIEQ